MIFRPEGRVDGRSMLITPRPRRESTCSPRTLARELLPYGIRTNAIAPGVVPWFARRSTTNPELKKAYEARIPPIEIGYTGPHRSLACYLR